MKYESTMNFKATIESINLESNAEYSRITFNHLKFDNPILDNLFSIMNAGEVVDIEIKRLVEKD